MEEGRIVLTSIICNLWRRRRSIKIPIMTKIMAKIIVNALSISFENLYLLFIEHKNMKSCKLINFNVCFMFVVIRGATLMGIS